MKMSTVILLLLMPMVAGAQNYQGMNEADMQKMMEQMQKMQSCMENVDQEQLKALEQRSYQYEAELKSLCASGKRDEAQKKAMLFGKEIAKDPAMKAMSKCREMAKGVNLKMPFMAQEEDASNKHVCD
jgi:hypothetical protein